VVEKRKLSHEHEVEKAEARIAVGKDKAPRDESK
jgi:hypothetical protein